MQSRIDDPAQESKKRELQNCRPGPICFGVIRRQTAFGTASLTYDDNGNLTSDGTNSYTWNARNQLVSMNGAGLSASFSYDAAGRRANKTINSSTTATLYYAGDKATSGWNYSLELSWGLHKCK